MQPWCPQEGCEAVGFHQAWCLQEGREVVTPGLVLGLSLAPSSCIGWDMGQACIPSAYCEIMCMPHRTLSPAARLGEMSHLLGCPQLLSSLLTGLSTGPGWVQPGTHPGNHWF